MLSIQFKRFFSPHIVTLSFTSRMPIEDFCPRLHVRDVMGSGSGMGTVQGECGRAQQSVNSVEEPAVKATQLLGAQVDLISVDGEGKL